MRLFGIYFANQQYLISFFLFAFVAVCIVINHRRLRAGLATLAFSRHMKMLFPGFSSRRHRFKSLLRITALFLFFIVLLQPQWGLKEEVVEQEGRDVLILLDVSRSMLARDMRPSRLEFAKNKIRSLLDRLDMERIGLILFSGSAFVQCPLTVDRAAFNLFLQQVDVETIASGTTALDAALSKAVQVFSTGVGRKNKLVVLVTDGEDFSTQLASVKRTAKKENITVVSLGIGTPQGAPVPIVDRRGKIVGHEKDASGKVAMTKLNEDVLQSVSKELHGEYVRATYGDGDVDRIVSFIRSFDAEKFGERKMSRLHDHYNWFALAAFVVLLLEWVV